MILTRTQFHRTQEAFYREVRNSPTKCTLLLTTVTPGTGFAAFTGESSRSVTEIPVPCLYRRSFTPSQRTKFGLANDVDATVHFSPKSYSKQTHWKLEKEKLKVVLLGITYIVSYVKFNAEIFDSCLSVELHLIQDTQGG